MKPKTFAALIGAAMLLIAVIAMSLTITVDDGGDDVDCGSGFGGLTPEASLRDSGHSLGRVTIGDYSEPNVTLEELCADKVETRQTWGWPLGGVGLVVALGGLLINAQSRPSSPASRQTVAPSDPPDRSSEPDRPE